MLIVVWNSTGSISGKAHVKSELYVNVQLWLNNGGTGQCECCYPPWNSANPDYTFLIPYLNETGMPGNWSYMVRLLLNCIQHSGQSEVLNTELCKCTSVYCHMDCEGISWHCSHLYTQGNYTYWGARLYSTLPVSTAPTTYGFQLQTDSAARLWINGQLVIDATCMSSAKYLASILQSVCSCNLSTSHAGWRCHQDLTPGLHSWAALPCNDSSCR